MTRAIQIACAALLIATLVGWVGPERFMVALQQVSGAWLITYALLTAAVLLGQTIRWRVIADGFGLRAPLSRFVCGRLAADAVSTLVPSARIAGEPVRVLATRRQNAHRTSEAAGAVVIDRLLEVIGNLVAVLAYFAVVCAVRGVSFGGPSWLVTVGAVLTGLIFVMCVVMYLHSGRSVLELVHGSALRHVGPHAATWVEAMAGFEAQLVRFCRERPGRFALGVCASLAIESAVVVQYASLLKAFGVVVDLPTLLTVLLGTGLAHAVPTPAGLGALEVTQIALVGAMAGEPKLGVIVAFVLRMHDTVLLGVGLAALAALGLSLSKAIRLRPTVDA